MIGLDSGNPIVLDQKELIDKGEKYLNKEQLTVKKGEIVLKGPYAMHTGGNFHNGILPSLFQVPHTQRDAFCTVERDPQLPH